MVFFVAFNNFIGILICFISVLKLFMAYRENKNRLVLDFLRFFLFLMMFLILLIFAIPDFFIASSRLANFFYSLSRFFVFLGSAYFIRIPLDVWQQKWLKKLLFGAYVLLAIITPFASIWFSQEAHLITIGPKKYLPSPEPLWLGTLIGILLASMAILTIIFFALNGIKSQDKFIKRKSFMAASGMTFLFFASIINFILNYLPNFSLVAYAFSSIAAWIGLLLILTASLQKEHKELELVSYE